MSTGENIGGEQLEFTWDPVKAASNVAKHGVTFAQAATVLTDALALTVFDAEHSEFEERWLRLGMSSEGELLAVMTAGAYGAVESSTYNTRPLVPEVLVKGTEAAVVRPRLEAEALIALDRMPPWLGGNPSKS